MCVIFMNDKTRFYFVLYGLKKEHFKDFGKIVIDAIAENFTAEGFDKDVIEKYIQKADEVLYNKTSDCSTLGKMNDILFMATHVYLEDLLIGDKLNQIEINKTLNRSPTVKWKYSCGFEDMKEEVLNKINVMDIC